MEVVKSRGNNTNREGVFRIPRGSNIREVFNSNFEEEERVFLSALSSEFNTIALETEFPGMITKTPRQATDAERYRDMKWNVERTLLVQVGFTVFNPVSGEIAGVWQFNLCGFDPTRHIHSPEAVQLLRESGIDFSRNNSRGVRMLQFVMLMKRIPAERIQWVTFHGLYDVGYLLAVVSRLWTVPPDVSSFSELAAEFFGGGIFDLKYMAGDKSWMGLEKLAEALGAVRNQGCAHQAGSDSLLTARAFISALQCSLVQNLDHCRGRLFGITQPIRRRYFHTDGDHNLLGHSN